MHPRANELACIYLSDMRFPSGFFVVAFYFSGRRRHRHHHHHSSWNNFSKCHVPIDSHQLPFFVRLWAESIQPNTQQTVNVYRYDVGCLHFCIFVFSPFIQCDERFRTKHEFCGNVPWHMPADWIAMKRQLTAFTQ